MSGKQDYGVSFLHFAVLESKWIRFLKWSSDIYIYYIYENISC